MIPKTLHKEWVELLADEFDKPYFTYIIKQYALAKSHATIFPPSDKTFHALNLTPPSRVRIVILGQDPYHGSKMIDGIEVPQAMGLSFSVPKGVAIPPSLRNIYKELESSLGVLAPSHGDLSAWAHRGALLLNAILSVEKHKAASHRHFGWENFSDAIISKLSKQYQGIVFMLWGNYARKKAVLIDSSKHCIIEAAHPSPLAQGFVGSGVFLQAQNALQAMGKEPFDWSLI
ncbi:uracil-DNA glycosylase [Helicobacter canis]|uniref:Uracil-DNA glycosylase n=1 Tax=Helicobacter canis NCTC 12740 TaxID=1357399 RepID=V8CLH1_9HELI|nr:uracil-DNA glycosylase [Helicobacter canis]ETD27591.1 uracil-DNA glycosylase [Helicobacter canis NCTC 12740]